MNTSNHEFAEQLQNIKNLSELDLRAQPSFEPETPEQLAEVVKALMQRQHDYGTCVYAMSHAAMAAFNLVASHLGVTGFQASCADLDILRRTRNIEGPFILLKGDDLLFPQYDLQGKLAEAIEGWQDYLKGEALKKLEEAVEKQDGFIHPDVWAHWEKLAGVSRPQPPRPVFDEEVPA